MILVTGSSGHLGTALVMTLRDQGHRVRGIDRLASPCTDAVGDIADPRFVDDAIHGVTQVLHTATLHKPHVVTHTKQQFIDTNVTGTLNLLDSAARVGVSAFVYTSTTSAFGDAMSAPAPDPAVWVTEALAAQPKNIYGVSKTAAEDLCALYARNHRLPCVVLRTSRFFPEADDSDAQRQAFDDVNLKVCEFLHRRVAIDDVVSAHTCALARAGALGFGKYIISATSPFTEADLTGLRVDPWQVLDARLPGMRQTLTALGWQLPDIDRVYVNARARQALDWQPSHDFPSVLQRVLRGKPWRSPLALRVGTRGYHAEDFGDRPFPV